MWLWLFIALLWQTARAAVPWDEPSFLWKEGQSAIQVNRYQDAVNYLQRLVDRYPGSQGYLKSQFYLGKAYLELEQPQKALSHLKAFISMSGINSDSAQARVLLGQSYLALEKFHEAYMTSLEMDRIEKNTPLASSITLESLLIKAQALLGMKHEIRAMSALETAEKQLTANTSHELESRIFLLKLNLKLFHCNQFPSPGPLSEGQLRDQLDRRGTCLLEALLVYQRILITGDLRTTSLATLQMNKSYQSYYQSCAHPKPLTNFKKYSSRSLSAIEAKRFRMELTDQLLEDFYKRTTQSLEFLASWKNQLPDSTTHAIIQLSDELRHLTRIPTSPQNRRMQHDF